MGFVNIDIDRALLDVQYVRSEANLQSYRFSVCSIADTL